MAKTKRSTSGSGNIRKRSDGRWEGRYTAGIDPGTGKQIQRSIYGKTQKDVRERLRQITVDLDTGTYQEPCSMKLGDWLDIWHSEYLNNVKPHTRASYAQTIRNHIKPALGSVRLDALTPIMMQKFINDLTKPKDDGSLLSAKTIKNIHGVIHRALNQAVRIGYLRTNPADYCIIPKVVQKQIHPLEETQIQTFLKAIQGQEEEFLFITALFTGMRQSELLGLQWQDIDFHTNSIFISRQLQKSKENGKGYIFVTPKNGKSRQIQPADLVFDTLRKQHHKQNQQRMVAGSLWSNSNNLVFTNAFGGNLTHVTVSKHFKQVACAIDRPDLRFHDLRHTYAVLSLQAGDDVKTLQENLGHHTAAFTLSVYGHVTDKMRHDSAQRMNGYIEQIVG